MSESEVYSFVFRGLLAEDALDSAGRSTSTHDEEDIKKIFELSGAQSISEHFVFSARRMAEVYTAIAAFENSVRQFVTGVMLESHGEDWWDDKVATKIREAAEKRKAEESKVKWHTQRGEDPIQFTMLPNLLNIIRANFDYFEPFLGDVDWTASIFDIIERSRNVIMHSGTLSNRDVARLGSAIRDWNSQVSS
jgi:hypothetical protein